MMFELKDLETIGVRTTTTKDWTLDGLVVINWTGAPSNAGTDHANANAWIEIQREFRKGTREQAKAALENPNGIPFNYKHGKIDPRDAMRAAGCSEEQIAITMKMLGKK